MASQMSGNRVDRRLAVNQNGKRKVVVIVRERNGQSVPAVFRTEGQARSWIKARIAKGTVVNADEATVVGQSEIMSVSGSEDIRRTMRARRNKHACKNPWRNDRLKRTPVSDWEPTGVPGHTFASCQR